MRINGQNETAGAGVGRGAPIDDKSFDLMQVIRCLEREPGTCGNVGKAKDLLLWEVTIKAAQTYYNVFLIVPCFILDPYRRCRPTGVDLDRPRSIPVHSVLVIALHTDLIETISLFFAFSMLSLDDRGLIIAVIAFPLLIQLL